MVKSEFPQFYFKFLSFNEHAIDTLEKLLENLVYTPLLSELNDPFEGSWFNNLVETIIGREDKELKDSFDRRRVYCLCSSESENFPFSQESIPMWTHYADSHKGFCILFSQNILNTADQEVCPRKIDYSDSMEEKTGQKDKDMTILFHKSSVWKSEKEVRMCFRRKNSDGTEHYYRRIPSNCVRAIFAGSRINKLNDCLLEGLSRKLGCEYHRLKLSNQSFGFEEII